MTRIFLALSIFTLAFASLACQPRDPDDRATSAPAAATSNGAGSSPTSEATEPAVEYDPAYPADVSGEGLTEGDLSQQESTHSHGDGEEHSHASRIVGIELLAHVRFVTGWHAGARYREAIEQVGGLDAEHHGHLARGDHLTRLGW